MKALLLLLCLLSGCTAAVATKNANNLVGKTFIEVVGLIGYPDHAAERSGNLSVAMWSWTQAPSSTALPLTDVTELIPLLWPAQIIAGGTLSIGTTKGCRFMITFRDDIAIRWSMSGDNAGISGKGAACEPVVRGAAP